MDISTVFGNRYSAYRSSARKTASEADAIGKMSEASDAEKLEAFKKKIWKEIDSLSWGSSISIHITDDAFEKMMNDSEFKDKMMNLIREDARGSHIMCGGTLININEDGYRGYSYMADHAKEAETAFEAHTKDKNSFYAKKVAKKQGPAEMWEKRRLERERQREKLNKEYVDKLYFNRNLLRK